MLFRIAAALPFFLLFLTGSCFANAPVDRIQTGIASYYSEDHRDLRTASGERFDPDALTAAHARLPLGTWVRVTNLFNGRSVDVRINDRNALSPSRIIDLSHAAARAVGMIRAGLAHVRIQLIPKPEVPGIPPRKPLLLAGND